MVGGGVANDPETRTEHPQAASVGRTRQRASWLAYLKEPPMRTPNGVAVGSPTFRLISIALLTLTLALGLTAAVAGAATLLVETAEVPPPFGLARNGLVAYAQGGDIHTVDPETGDRQAIVTGPEEDQNPRWSLDGTRLLFLRTAGDRYQLGVVDPGHLDEPVMSEALPLDGDRVRWSPDARSIAVGLEAAVLIIDAATGEATPIDIDVPAEDLFWRPPDGRQAMVVAGDELHLLDLDSASSTPVVAPGSGGIRASGWTPDGSRFVYQRGEFDELPFETHVLDLVTGDDVVIDAGYGRVSNDGTRMVMLQRTGSAPCLSREGCPSQMCVVDLGGGDCSPVGLASQAYYAGHAEGAQWAPDDRWLLTVAPAGDGFVSSLVDPDGAIVDQPAWISDGGESWQRQAP
jgi:dipeptidyl aminopeptidase/acylaminoacyl peptidase